MTTAIAPAAAAFADLKLTAHVPRSTMRIWPACSLAAYGFAPAAFEHPCFLARLAALYASGPVTSGGVRTKAELLLVSRNPSDIALSRRSE